MIDAECAPLRGETVDVSQRPQRSVARVAAVTAVLLAAAAFVTLGVHQWSSVHSKHKTPVSLQETVGYVQDLINQANIQLNDGVTQIRASEASSDWEMVARTAHTIDRLKEHLATYNDWNEQVLQAMKHLDDGEYEASDEKLKDIRRIKCMADHEGLILELEGKLADYASQSDFEHADEQIKEIETKEASCE